MYFFLFTVEESVGTILSISVCFISSFVQQMRKKPAGINRHEKQLFDQISSEGGIKGFQHIMDLLWSADLQMCIALLNKETKHEAIKIYLKFMSCMKN